MPGPAHHFTEAMTALSELDAAMRDQRRRGCPDLEQAKSLGEILGAAAANVAGAAGEEGFDALSESFLESSIRLTGYLGSCERRNR